MNRILIIDDDKELCVLIKQSVLQESIEADCCYSGKSGLLQLKEKEYQLVILDVMMPGFDGFETLEQIRKESSLPILMLTSKNDSASKVRGLRAGADDYLTKPFDMDELIARILSLIRRYTRFNPKDGQLQTFDFDGLSIDLNSRSIHAVNGDYELPPKEFDLLLLLAKNQGKILTKQQIYENVWGEEYVYDDSNIMAIISRLRKKIEENPGNPHYIQTVKGIGYRFNREVLVLYKEAVTIIAFCIAFVSMCVAVLTVWRVKKQISEISDALEDIKNGNGNRRILAETHELVAPLAYALNDIILSYESRLSAYHQTEETNRQLMTSLSHDVRTPLTTLIGYLDAAHKGIVNGKERDDYIETARRKAHDLKEYIDVLFDWFKLGSNEFSMNISTVDLTELTRNILIDWIPIFEDAQIDFAADIPEQPFRVQIDPDGYMRILNNLIQNVISHSQADKVEIALSGMEGNIKIFLSDNGVGIDKEDLKHIFERLYKCDKGRSEKGSGLGLSIVHQLVAKLNGTITAESILGKGTVFILIFPLAE